MPAGIELIAYGRDKSDLPDGEFCCTALDRAESEPELPYAVNAAALAVRGGRLLQVSTDFVINGNQGSPYRPEQPVDHGQVGCPTSTHSLAAESHGDRSIDGPAPSWRVTAWPATASAATARWWARSAACWTSCGRPRRPMPS